MTETKKASLKGGIPPSPPKTRRFIFTIMMAGALASILAIYKIALPFMENRSYLGIAVITGIIFIVIAYAMAIKGGIPPAPPKTEDK